VTQAQPDCRIYVVAEAGKVAAEHLPAAATAADVACCLIVPAPGKVLDAAAARPLVEAAQRAGMAALIADDGRLARALRADGVHLAAEPVAAYAVARETLGRGAIVGASAGLSRHDAMSLAEAGADYVAFGAPGHVQDRVRARERRDDLVAWWGEIFEVPCVALDVETPEEAERLARAGADFIGVTLTATGARDLVARIGAAIGAVADAD
jgi:thiamine-phosphate pyrophosphorylase